PAAAGGEPRRQRIPDRLRRGKVARGRQHLRLPAAVQLFPGAGGLAGARAFVWRAWRDRAARPADLHRRGAARALPLAAVRVRLARPARAVLPARRHGRTLPPAQLWAGGGAGLRWFEDAARRPHRPADPGLADRRIAADRRLDRGEPVPAAASGTGARLRLA